MSLPCMRLLNLSRKDRAAKSFSAMRRNSRTLRFDVVRWRRLFCSDFFDGTAKDGEDPLALLRRGFEFFVERCL